MKTQPLPYSNSWHSYFKVRVRVRVRVRV